LFLELNSSIFQTMRTIPQIIKAAGGARKIAVASKGTVTAEAVYKWSKNGIPDRHWPIVMPLSGATANELLRANVAVRRQLGTALREVRGRA
jgi:hypothetical protein